MTQQLIVYGPDGKTPIDPRSLPADAQEDLRKFARFCARSFLFKDYPPREVAPEWATPLRTSLPPAPPVSEEIVPAQTSMFPMAVREKRNAKKQVRSVAE